MTKIIILNLLCKNFNIFTKQIFRDFSVDNIWKHLATKNPKKSQQFFVANRVSINREVKKILQNIVRRKNTHGHKINTYQQICPKKSQFLFAVVVVKNIRSEQDYGNIKKYVMIIAMIMIIVTIICKQIIK